MKREEFIALGLTEEQATKAAEASLNELKGFIPKSRFDEVNEAKKKIDTDLAERNNQLEELKKSAGSNEELRKQIETLQTSNSEKEENYKKELEGMKLNNALEIALIGSKAKNTKAIKALLNMENVKLKEDGTIDGLDSQIKELKEKESYLFEGDSKKGFNPGNSGDGGNNGQPKTLGDAVASFFTK